MNKEHTDNYLNIAKELIDEYCNNEFGHGADFRNLSSIGVAYTTVESEEIQVNVNLVDFRIERYLNGILFETRQYDSLKTLIFSELENLDFDELTYVEDEQLAEFLNIVCKEN